VHAASASQKVLHHRAVCPDVTRAAALLLLVLTVLFAASLTETFLKIWPMGL
jgi:hypothetical protein